MLSAALSPGLRFTMEPRPVFFACPDDVVSLLSSPLLDSMEACDGNENKAKNEWKHDALWSIRYV